MAGFDRGGRGDKGGFRGGNKGGFSTKGGFGGGRGFSTRGGQGSGFRGGSRGDRPTEMHDAVCSSCGKDCQVPFRPTGDKPVFCRDCFSKQGGGRELGRKAGERGSMQATHSNMAPIMPQRSNDSNTVNGELKRQIEQISNKLDKLISIVQGMNKPQTQKVETAPVVATSAKSIKKPASKVAKSTSKKVVKKINKK